MSLAPDPPAAAAHQVKVHDYDRARPFGRMRCACERCGSHTITNVGFAIAGNCSLCGSYELRPLEPA